MDDIKMLKFLADRKYALHKRLFERRLEEKYQKLMRLGFHAPSGRKAYIQQLQEAHKAELYIGLTNLKGDVEAEFFGMKGMEEFEKTSRPNESKPPLLPTSH